MLRVIDRVMGGDVGSGEWKTLLLGMAIGVVAMGLAWWIATRRRRPRQETPTPPMDQIRLPVVNPTVSDDAEESSETNPQAPSSAQDLLQAKEERDAALRTMTKLRGQVQSLSLELERVEQHDAQTANRWKEDQQRLATSEAGLNNAHREIAEIRAIVTKLGSAKPSHSDTVELDISQPDEDVIDLR